jgi:hypothetical protein
MGRAGCVVDGTPVPVAGRAGHGGRRGGSAGPATGVATRGGEDVFPFPVRWMADGGFLYTADGAVRVRDAEGNHLRDIPFEATLTLEPARGLPRARAGWTRPGPTRCAGSSRRSLSPDGGAAWRSRR